MAYVAKGLSGTIKVGGRKAASLGRWELTSQGGLQWICDARLVEMDEYWLSMPSPKELHLDVGDKVHVYKNVQIGGGGDSLTISGQGAMQVRSR